MAKFRKKGTETAPEQSKSAARDEHEGNYSLQSKAVETLANADKEPAPQYSKEELNKYRSKKGFKIPKAVKILFLKAWMPGAVCFFILWGLGNYIGTQLDMMVVLGFVMGLVTDLLTNSIIRYFAETEGANDEWMMFPKKGLLSFFLNLIYGYVILLMVFMTYNRINIAANSMMGTTDQVVLGVEPIVFGLLCMAFDMLLIGIKRVFIMIFQDAKKKAAGEN